MSHPPAPPPPKHWLIRRADQVTVAVLIASGLASVIGWWLMQGGMRGRAVEIEKAEPQSAQFQVDVNKAAWPELANLPDIGEKMARRIVESREEEGPFTDFEDLRRVRGIGPRTLESLRPYVRPIPPRQAVARE
jgi:competence protein ComEA